MKRILLLAVSTFVIGFGLFWLAGVFLTDALIFHPPEPGYEQTDLYKSTEMADGTRIVYRVWENPESDRVMIYSHGNAEDIGNLDWVMPLYQGLGYTVVAYDYPGYGHSGGTPSVQGSIDALLSVIQTVSEDRNLTPDQLTLFGKSIGGGPSVAAAAQVPVGGLILESSFTSIFQVLLPSLRLPLDSFPNARLLKNVSCPVLIIHGTRDEVIAPSHASRLYEAANDPKRLIWMEGGGHNDILFVQNDDYQPAIRDFPDSVR
jgi:alpha-beta hydrolase superfamily lysophospholipase